MYRKPLPSQLGNLKFKNFMIYHLIVNMNEWRVHISKIIVNLYMLVNIYNLL